MVEFGLKLQDNRVSEWSDAYLRYEKLKQILKKCKGDVQRYKELANKRPVLAAAIRQAYRDGVPTPLASSDNLQSYASSRGASAPATPSRKQQRGSDVASAAAPLNTVLSPSNMSRVQEQLAQLESRQQQQAGSQETTTKSEACPPQEEGVSYEPPLDLANETTVLLKDASSQDNIRSNLQREITEYYGSNSSAISTSATTTSKRRSPTASNPRGLDRSDSNNSIASVTSNLTSVFGRAASGVSDYFRRPYERQVRDALKEIDKREDEFKECLLQDVQTVNEFYQEKLRELQDRLGFLKETVAQSRAGEQPSSTVTESRPSSKSKITTPPSSPIRSARKTLASESNDTDRTEEDDEQGAHAYQQPPQAELDDDKETSLLLHSTPKKKKVQIQAGMASIGKGSLELAKSIKLLLSADHPRTGGGVAGNRGERSFSAMKISSDSDLDIPIGGGEESGDITGGVQKQLLLSDDQDDNNHGDGVDDEGSNHSRSQHKQKDMYQERAKRIREAESIQRALVDQYRTAKLLHNFAIMNYTGFVKIVKKHDKSLLEEYKGRFKKEVQPERICNEGKEVEALAERMEVLYANWFCGGNKSEARVQIMPKRGDGLEMDWSQLRLGYRMGMCSILCLWVCWDCIWGLVSEGASTIGGRTAFPVFRGVGGLLLLQWFWGMSVWVWSRYRVNYIYLFDFNPRIVDSPLSIFNSAVDNTLVFLLFMLLYYKAGAHHIPGDFPAGVFPLLLVLYTVFQLVFPLRTRLPMWNAMSRVVSAPMFSPSFFHGYVGDIFTSMVKVFQDLAWTICFVFSGDWLVSEDLSASTKHKWAKSSAYKHFLIPLLTLAPLWFRFNQCLRRYTDTGDRFPHLANALKYALSQTVTLFGAFHPLYLYHNSQRESELFQLFWTFAFVGSSLYSFFWDVYMDWGLGRPKFNFLGPRLMYPKRIVYYTIIVCDLVLRFAWVLTLIPPDAGANFALPHYLTAVSMMLELGRRTVWGFLRLENEHRSNTSGFRRVDFVPLHFSTGHEHGYKVEKEHRGISVLLEVAIVTILVLAACVVSVVAAQHATDRLSAPEL